MNKDQLIQTMNSFLVEKLDFDASHMVPDAELRRDLGISSVDATAIIAFVQKTFGCSVILPELKAMITLQDLYDYIELHS